MTPLPDPALDVARDALSAHYAAELGEPFTTAGLCYYRDGHDSVAWHGDRIGRGRTRGHHGRDRLAGRAPRDSRCVHVAAASRSASPSATATSS